MNMRDILQALLLKNRTIASSDNEECLNLLQKILPLKIHRYPSGKDYDTWIIPPKWDVVKAELSDGSQNIASYKDHPLFLAPYSCSFKGWVNHSELLQHIRTNPTNPESYVYEHRFAYDLNKRLTDWAITLPHNTLKKLNQSRYFIDIQVDTSPGEMLIGESQISGTYPHTFIILSHLCHPGQANDGLAGVAVGIELLKRIKQSIPQPKYNYRLLILPETIGSAVYAADHVRELDSFLGAIFFEMPGSQAELRLKHSRRATTYLDRIFEYVLHNRKVPYHTSQFHDPYGNDESVFDYPGINIPALSLQRYPLETYHTSADDMSGIHTPKLEECVDIAFEAIKLMERDYIPHFRQRVPVYLSRYNLYIDDVVDHQNRALNTQILEMAWQDLSAFDIATQLNIPPQKAMDFLDKFCNLNLIDPKPLMPQYFRNTRT